MASLEHRLDLLIKNFVAADSRRHAQGQVAEAIAYSPAQAARIFKSRFGEPPGAFRRRIALERAAEMLVLGKEPIWKVALEAGFGSPEPFIRAFQKAYKVLPSRFRAMRSTQSIWLASAEQAREEEKRLHFWRGTIVSSTSKGEKKMNLIDRLIGHDLWLTGAMLDRAKSLTDGQLDTVLDQPVQVTSYEEPDKTLRDILDNLVFTKEIWLAAMYNRECQWERDKSTAGLTARWQAVEPEFRSMVDQLESEGRWDDQFVDAMCCPPVTFSFGGVFAHILTHSALRKAMALMQMRSFGIDDLGFGEPIEWERALTPA